MKSRFVHKVANSLVRVGFLAVGALDVKAAIVLSVSEGVVNS